MADRGVAADLGSRALLGNHVGGFQDFAAFDVPRQHGGIDGFDRRAGKAQGRRRGAGFVADLEADIEAAAARVVPGRDRLHRAGIRRLELDIAHVAIEGQGQIGGVAEAAAMLQRVGNLEFDLPGRQRARQPGHGNRLDVLGVDADHLMRLQCGEHLFGWQRAGGAEIGRAIDRDQRRGAGIVEDVADPHHVAGDVDAGAQHRRCDDVVAALGQCRRGAGREQGACQEKRTHGHDHSHRNSAEVVCSIWSAALITLAFIS